MKAKVLECLKKQFGIEKINFEIEVKGKGRVYAFKSCEFEIEGHRGIYIGTLEKDGFRPSIDGSFLIGPLAKKNVVEVGDEDAMRWMSGSNIPSHVTGYVILKWRDFFIGCGRGNGRTIRNFVPKDRRISVTAKY